MKFQTQSHAIAIAFSLLVIASTFGGISFSAALGETLALNISKNHQLWDHDEDIRQLQKFLNANGFSVARSNEGSPGHETTVFGLLTFRALKRFQTSRGLPATGYLGPLTRVSIAAFTARPASSSLPGTASKSKPTIASSTPCAFTNIFCGPSLLPYPGFGGGGTPNATSPTISVTPPPTISGMPSNITAQATSTSGATVTYTSPTATDSIDGTVAVSCSPASGSTFAVGATTVACSATNSRGVGAQSTFTVTVQDVATSIATSNVTDTQAAITWTTYGAASSQVNYGTDNSYGSASSSATLTTSHSITLTGLTASTPYHFQVQSADSQSNLTTSADQTFTTGYPLAGLPAPVAAYGFRLLIGSYTGALIQARCSTASTTLDVYPTALGGLDTAAVTAFCGTGTVTVAKVYDQMGGTAAAQGTIASQPSYTANLDALNGHSAMYYTGGGAQQLSVSDSSSIQNIFGSGGGYVSVVVAADKKATAAWGILSKTGWTLTLRSTGNVAFLKQNAATTNGQWITTNAFDRNDVPDGQGHVVEIGYSNASLSNLPTITFDGQVQTSLAVSTQPVGTITTDAAKILNIGGSGGATAFPGYIGEVILWGHGNLPSDAQLANLRADQIAYWGTQGPSPEGPTYFNQAMIGSVLPGGIDVVMQSAPPTADDASTNPAFLYYPVTRAQTNSGIAAAAASTWTNTPPGSAGHLVDHLVWVNRCTGCAGNPSTNKPNPVPTTVVRTSNGSECRLEYSTLAKSEAATKSAMLFSAGAAANSAGAGYQDVATAQGMTVYAHDSSSTNPDGLTAFSTQVDSLCTRSLNGYVTALDVVVLPAGRLVDVASARRGCIAADWEPQDGRTDSGSFVSDLVTSLAAVGNTCLNIYTNQLTGISGQRNGWVSAAGTSLTESTPLADLNTLAQTVRQFYVLLPSATNCSALSGQPPIENSYLNQIALFTGSGAVTDCANGSPANGAAAIPYTHLGIFVDLKLTNSSAQFIASNLQANPFAAVGFWSDNQARGGPQCTAANQLISYVLGGVHAGAAPFGVSCP